MERYRSGHNGADSKSDGRGNPARGFESRPLRQLPQHYYLRRSDLIGSGWNIRLYPGYIRLLGKNG